MARPKKIVPTYRFHKARNCAVVRIDGRDHYLPGAYESPASRREYARLLAGCDDATEPEGPASIEPTYTVGRLAADYMQFAKAYYVKHGRETRQVNLVKQSLRTICRLYEQLPAADFGPLKLKNVQQLLTSDDQARSHINKQVACIKLAFRWAASEEKVPAGVFHALQTVGGLKRGRTTARETKPVLPVDEGTVNETVKHLSPTVAAMVQLQRLTGMRPAEVCQLRPMDLTFQLDGVACYRPESHKCEHLGRERRVYLGKRALAVLKPFLEREPEAYCFSPAESAAWHFAQRRQQRKTPLWKSHAARYDRNRKIKPGRAPKDRFETASYRRAIERACIIAFSMPDDLTPALAREWREKYCWAPNQLRHLRATELRRKFGIESASVVLGHSNLAVTQVYAERDFEQAAEIMRQIG